MDLGLKNTWRKQQPTLFQLKEILQIFVGRIQISVKFYRETNRIYLFPVQIFHVEKNELLWGKKVKKKYQIILLICV